MGIREWFNGHPKVAVTVVGGCTVLAIGFITWQILAGRRAYPTKSPDSYFTIDDGKTYFVASSDNIPPFGYGGKTAVHAYVFKCSGKPFVGYLERYIPEVHKMLVAGKPHTIQTERFGRELKKPGETKWIRSGDLITEARITKVSCPDGHDETLEEVEP